MGISGIFRAAVHLFVEVIAFPKEDAIAVLKAKEVVFADGEGEAVDEASLVGMIEGLVSIMIVRVLVLAFPQVSVAT
jgi:SpoU rRNA methylase family enzyme